MKKFKFRLQALLKLREQIESERQKSHSAVLRQIRDQKDRNLLINQTREDLKTNQRKKQIGRISIAELLVFSRYAVKLKRDTITGSEIVTVLKRDEASKRHELLKATRERKKYEKLRERQQEKFFSVAKAREEKEQGEYALNGFRIKNNRSRQ